MSFKIFIRTLIVLVLLHSTVMAATNIDHSKGDTLCRPSSSLGSSSTITFSEQEARGDLKASVNHNEKKRLTKIEGLGSLVVMSAVIVRLILYVYGSDSISLAEQVGVNAALGFGAIGGALKGCLGAQRVSELKDWIAHCWKNTSSYAEFNKKIWGTKKGKKEVCVRSMLALFGVWISVSSGLDGL